MSAVRSVNQVKADDFDMKLYALICTAEARSFPNGDGRKWRAVHTLLLQARPPVHDMMHPDDRKITS